jgi:NAD(P)-dependent dehydrogenase (short-subunit alcohol dehydrogenase family)
VSHEGRTAVVAGATRGLGRQYARQLAGEGRGSSSPTSRPLSGTFLVLLAATAALALHARGPRPDATTNHQLPDAHDPAHSTPTQDAA